MYVLFFTLRIPLSWIAREVQTARKETGPLSPEHIREAYRLYTIESGRVGAALPARGKRLFMR